MTDEEMGNKMTREEELKGLESVCSFLGSMSDDERFEYLMKNSKSFKKEMKKALEDARDQIRIAKENEQLKAQLTESKATEQVLGERVLQLQKDKGKLLDENKELKKELAISEHDREHNDYELTETYLTIEKLKAQNEKFRCCGNCKHWDHESIQKYCLLTEPNFLITRQLDTCNRWEFAK